MARKKQFDITTLFHGLYGLTQAQCRQLVERAYALTEPGEDGAIDAERFEVGCRGIIELQKLDHANLKLALGSLIAGKAVQGMGAMGQASPLLRLLGVDATGEERRESRVDDATLAAELNGFLRGMEGEGDGAGTGSIGVVDEAS